jgi:TolA-binding protein
MSRARVHEVSSPLSLFPFIGILLCTMGALLVILVVVSKSAKDNGVRDAQARQGSDVLAATEGTHKKIEEVQTYIGSLNAVRGKAEGRLKDEQSRLGDVEDHIRRLHERIEAIQSAAVELQALEQEHYDDHKQAEREVERLNKLIDDSKKSLAAMQDAGSKNARSYAVVPYEGPNATFRRPIYIECVKDELILQPEGVRITADDLRPPMGPGNSLASVLRAARDHLNRMNPQAGENHDLMPYPLLLVRPDGVHAYHAALEAIQAGDFDLGYELVESDWKLKFPAQDPQLAAVEAQALEQARARQQILAAAAPRAYANASMTSADDLGDDGDYGSGGGGGGFGGGGGGAGGGAPRDYVVHNGRHGGGDNSGGDGEGGSAGESSGGPAGGSSQGGDGTAAGDTAGSGGGSLTSSDSGGAGSGAPSGIATGSVGAGSRGGSSSGGGDGQPPVDKATDKGLTPEGYQNDQSASVMAGTAAPSGSPPPDLRTEKQKAMAAENRGKDWALKQKPPRSVPVRRTIRVTVNNDQLTILPDSGPATAGGKTIPMRGDTVESVDEFVKQVRDHIDGWGIAGTNLYWRPVVVLSVSPDGQRRASDLTRLLKNSGLEVRPDETAKNLPQEGAHETR